MRTGRRYQLQADTEEKGGTMATLEQMMELLRAERREERLLWEKKLEAEEKRHKEELEARRKESQEQIEMMKKLIDASPGQSAARAEFIKIAKLTENEDIEAYLTTFERIMTIQRADEDLWIPWLAPQLTGKAQQAFAALTADDSRQYKLVKEAILRRYDINEETYRQRFRTAEPKEGETPVELARRLQDTCDRWLKKYDSREKVVDAIVKEQLLESLTEEARIFVKEKKPKDSMDAAKIAKDYRQARGTKMPFKTTSRSKTEKQVGTKHCHTCTVMGHLAWECRKSTVTGGKPNEDTNTSEERKKPGENKVIRCYNCGKPGHIATNCPSDSLFCESETQGLRRGMLRKGVVEGQAVDDILLDTGCTKTLVREDLVPAEKRLEGDAVTLRCAHGDVVLYPLADVEMMIEGVPVRVEAAMSSTLPRAVLLGTDVPQLGDLLKKQLRQGSEPGHAVQDALVVTTRARARKQQEEEESLEKERQSGVQPHQLLNPAKECETTTTNHSELGSGSPFAELHDDLFTTGRERVRLSHAEKRSECHQHNREHNWSNPDGPRVQEGPLDNTRDELRRLQKDDSSLDEVRRVVCSGVGSTGFVEEDGILYRWAPRTRNQTDSVKQLVLPLECRGTVLKLAHKIPLAGHLGRDKTAKRILQRFYWPTLFRYVKRFCQECMSCQKTSGRRVPRAPLIPLPAMSVPFERIAMDIVGPLPKSRTGNRYILVICDYATRYPEAIPLRSIDADHVARELIPVFSRMGIPREILTDQGSNLHPSCFKKSTGCYMFIQSRLARTTPRLTAS